MESNCSSVSATRSGIHGTNRPVKRSPWTSLVVPSSLGSSTK